MWPAVIWILHVGCNPVLQFNLSKLKSGHNNTRLRDGPRAVRRSDLGFLTVMAFNLEHAC